jgi:hypothetical protein
MSLKNRIISWLLWKLNGWKTLEDARFECLEAPDVTTMAGLCRDRFYILQSKERDAE